jgi:hypothetical protein
MPDGRVLALLLLQTAKVLLFRSDAHGNEDDSVGALPN